MAFGKNSKDPFSTPVGHLIEINTVGTLQTEDWGQFMNICDFINTTAEGPKDAIKALKKRISKNYNQAEVRYSLSLLEMCMQNCSPVFQSLVLKKEFSRDVLVKMLSPKYNLPVDMQNKILYFIMIWANDLQGKADVTEIKEVYLELLKKGIKFPSLQTNGEMLESPEVQKQSRQQPTCRGSEDHLHHLTSDQIGKLYSEMDMVRMNVKVMSEILLETIHGTGNPEDMTLLQELQKTCQEMQKRILKLLETVQNEDVIIELVQVNDDLNNVFLRHERFSRTRANKSMEEGRQSEVQMADSKGPSAPLCELISLDIPALPVNPFQTDVFLQPDPAFLTPPPTQHSSQLLDTNAFTSFGMGNPTPMLYPQMDLQRLRDAVDMPISLKAQLPDAPPRNLYENISTEESVPSTLPTLTPTILPLQNSKQMSLEEKKSEVSEKSYDFLEFDPLAQSHESEPIYEEIDNSSWKPTIKIQSNC